jgi:nucleoside-diphosphate-sugar epimerase
LPRPPFLLAAQLVQSYRDARGQRGSMHLAHGLRRVTANLRFSARALRKDTGWQSRVSFDQGMRLTFS